MAFLDETGLQALWTKIKGLFVTATDTRDGLMTSAQYTKLKNIAENANNYSLPDATKTVKGGVIVGDGIFVSNGKISVPNSSSGASGLMTAGQYNKLDGIEDEAEKNTVYSVAGRTGNVTISKSDVGLGNVTNESKSTMFTNPAFTGTPTAPTAANTTNTTQIATTAFVQSVVNSKVSAAEAMRYKGTIGVSGATIQSLPAQHSVGDTYKVISAATYAGKKCEVGDMIVCNTTSSTSNDSHWDVIQTNIDGAVTGSQSSVTAGTVAVFDGTTGKVIKSSGFTIGKSVPSDAKFSDTTYVAATTSKDGLMSKTTVEAFATTAVTMFNDVDADVTPGETSINVHWDVLADDINYLTGAQTENNNLGYVDFTIPSASTSAAGLMSKADKVKLNGISAIPTATIEALS